jgi:hypothetical protein
LRRSTPTCAPGGTSENHAAFEELRRARSDMTFADAEQLQKARDRYCLGSSDD